MSPRPPCEHPDEGCMCECKCTCDFCVDEYAAAQDAADHTARDIEFYSQLEG